MNIFNKLINKILSNLNIFILYRLGNAVGDQLLMTGIVKLIFKKYNYKIIVLTKFPELFINNPNVYKVYKIHSDNIFHNLLIKIIKRFNSSRIKEFLNNHINVKVFNLCDYQNMHIAEYHAKNLNLNLNFKNFKNNIFFTASEKMEYDKNLNLPKEYCLIQSEGKKTFTLNREWGVQNFQRVVDLTYNHINWIQIGNNSDFKLKNTLQCYTKSNLRELAYIIYKSKLLVCLEGFYYHLANSFKKKKILIMSGFMHEKNIFYNNNNNIFIKKTKNLKCYPCYKLYDCDVPGKPCTDLISYKDVIKVINENFN